MADWLPLGDYSGAILSLPCPALPCPALPLAGSIPVRLITIIRGELNSTALLRTLRALIGSDQHQARMAPLVLRWGLTLSS